MSADQTPTVRLGVDEWKSEWLIGGHVALDFVNTVPWRLDPGRMIERLPDGVALIHWCCAVGMLDSREAERLRVEVEADPGLDRTVGERARELREGLYRLLQPVAIGQPPPGLEVAWMRQSITDALAHAEIATVVPLHWVVRARGVRDLPRVLALAAWRLLQFGDLTRLRQCQDRGCGWLFLDRSKNASRVWCSSADCGNRTRARRHHKRRRGPSQSPENSSDAGK